MFAFLAILLAATGITLDNAAFRLVVGEDARVRSLVLKANGRECVSRSEDVPLFSVTQDRPFNNEVKLIHTNKRTTYPATRLRQTGDALVVGFEHGLYEARVRVGAGAGYAVFTLEDFVCDRKAAYDDQDMDVPPVASFRVLQIETPRRRHFGDWLNASWDETAAVGVVGTSPAVSIDHAARGDALVLYGELFAGRVLRGGSAALIAAPGREAFLDAMDALEGDFGLPRGVRSRRNPIIEEPIFHLSSDFSPTRTAEAIAYAREGGFRLVTLNMAPLIGTTPGLTWGNYGDYELDKGNFPNGMRDLRTMLGQFHAAGLKVGLHTLHSHIGLKSHYVTPVADVRLNKTRRFTLVDALPRDTNALARVRVHEPTADAVMHAPCRVLQFGGELFTYERYTTEPPYAFVNVTRGAWQTRVTAHPAGTVGGILDISEFGTPGSCYIDQNTDLQDEVAKALAKIYNAGFDYVYLDGSEGVNRPFDYHIANAQYRFWRQLRPEPLFGEGAAKTHFGWHMLGGANAFDCFSPRVFKEKLRAYPIRQAPKTWQDMSRVDFGWWGFSAPGEKDWWGETVGVQPDMWEFGLASAMAWNGASSMLLSVDTLKAHPRTHDILAVIRRWNAFRRSGKMDAKTRETLRTGKDEHHLLTADEANFEVVRVEEVAEGFGKVPVRAFAFERDGYTWVHYWHVTEKGTLHLPLAEEAEAKFVAHWGDAEEDVTRAADGIRLPAGDAHYLRTRLTIDALRTAFARSRLL